MTLSSSCNKRLKSVESANLRVAVASSSGVAIDQHFATSPFFFIYEYDENNWKQIEMRQNSKQTCSCIDGFNPHSFESITELIADCCFILASRVGPAAAVTLLEKGIRAHIASGQITIALEEFQKTSKFQHPLSRKQIHSE
ncbi:MAG TPA: NifB/NifX family molybdenum-iron cluster-binding protein [Chitinispirillaceae bacterium]|nr:NifB/NifX family molybdenum-iron cluster-binding protein [Chitinispirillaceae bacterium]